MKPNATNAKYAILFIWIALVLRVMLFVWECTQRGFQRAVSDITFSNISSISDVNAKYVISIIGGIAFIASIVFFLRWFKTAYHNLHQKRRNLNYTKGWALGGWFIPIGNIFIPREIMKEIYIQARFLLRARDGETRNALTLRYVGWWWVLWIIVCIPAFSPIKFSPNFGEVFALVAGTVYNIATILLALITIKVIKDYARVEPLLQQIAPPPPHTPPPPLPSLKPNS